MACERCKQEGKAKTIHFERGGRWETRIFCEHTYKRARLSKNQIHHVEAEDKIKRKVPRKSDRITYTPEMDAFILTRYGSKGRWVRTKTYGQGEMKLLAKAFGEQFGIANVRPNQLIGRWNRLRNREQDVVVNDVGELEEDIPVEYGVPSLPVLKFMQS